MMKRFGGLSFSAAVVASAFSLAGGAMSAKANTSTTDLFNTPNVVNAIDLANNICQGGNVAGSLVAFAATPDVQALALGEAARQLAAGNCAATQAAIDAALQALLAANPGNAQLQIAYNNQKNSGNGAQGNGIKGLYVDQEQSVGETLVGTVAGESVSQE